MDVVHHMRTGLICHVPDARQLLLLQLWTHELHQFFHAVKPAKREEQSVVSENTQNENICPSPTRYEAVAPSEEAQPTLGSWTEFEPMRKETPQ
ncbi:hypothetical protein E2C01_041951 [Portunus trituberculatus]|uniref:Uncharacterized protein n=1 Tax=Portunus trituberculatus TaxID=210409 RepID=A0A5B7FT22_PORTR|nr:hypothetical protein [Portunus trituberculatus]